MGETDAAGTPAFEMTWSSTTSSGYCSQEDSDSELEQYFTARTSLARKPRREQVGGRAGLGGRGAGPGVCLLASAGRSLLQLLPAHRLKQEGAPSWVWGG